MEKGYTRNEIISVLTKSPHGDLKEYEAIGLPASKEDPDFFAHLIAWNHFKGQIRDSKVALPVIAMASGVTEEHRENAAAAISALGPRELLRAVRYSKSLVGAPRREISRMAEQRLRKIEHSKSFERTVMQHKGTLKELYALLHIKPSEMADKIIFKGEKIGVFKDIAALKDMPALEAAGVIMTKRIPFLVARGALGEKAKDPALVQALIESMTATELVTNSKMLDSMGVKTNPALRAAYQKGLAKVADSGKATLKTSVAAAAVGGDSGEKLRAAQEKQLSKMSVEGDWLILADRSSSMSASIELARQISAVIARVGRGAVHLSFFNSDVVYYNVTGKTLEEIQKLTMGVVANGGTLISAGVRHAKARGISVDGIVIVSDGGENPGHTTFADAYKAYSEWMGREVPVYFYQLKGDPPYLLQNCKTMKVELSVIDLMGGIDYYSIPNLVQTMRTNKFSLADEIMETPLLKLGRNVNREEEFA